ncbi:MAG: integration host factor subunit beta [Chitinispirillales bacterium]|jgi:nucleoid DNA-binding protein|nr:integration host factor subunit beta [Chitinispirillales bacterium]
MATTTKQDLIAVVSRATGLTQTEIKIAIEEFLAVFVEELERGRGVELRGFGTFYVRERQPRPARNPRTGEVVSLDRRMVPVFKYSGEFKKRIALEVGTADENILRN